ncbi:glycyl-radical enzyme activating protein family [Candidatus Vecturithrix granuli]|uniref:Glycyl-radical enzyme activating protein family n=1 Tax=Vecturithrix granuli TaxID=1499967 RepID=A0A081C2Q0_VECG1|nr:glycyl-radical enzyme activating protein family [Candidatus Vecturithrix granuli]
MMNQKIIPSGSVLNIQRYAVHDGPGIRVVVFLKGCPLRCWWCHNPESQQLQCKRITQTVKLDDRTQVEEEETIGQLMSVNEVMRAIEKEVIFFDQSGGGVTFSGGEPFMQPQFLDALLTRCQEQEIHTAVDTTGYAAPYMFEPISEKVDIFLYDLKLIDDTLHRQYTGVSNELTLKNLHSLSVREKQIWIRFPVIPGITDTVQNVYDIQRVISRLKGVQQVNLLPFHKIADGKYRKFGLENKMKDIQPPSDDQMAALKEQFEQQGFPVKIGG